MDNDDGRTSISINIPRPKVYSNISYKVTKIGSYCKIKKHDKMHRKPSDVTLRKYSLPGDIPLHKRNFKKDELLLSFIRFAKQQNVIRHKQRMTIHISDKYKIIATDLRNRLHIDNPSSEVRTIKDIDEDFFSFVNGRKLTNRGACYKSLFALFNYKLRKTMEIGYRNDTIFNIDLIYMKEQKKYDSTVIRCREQVKYFDQCILEDYQSSMELLKKWEKVKNLVYMKNIELQTLAVEIFTTTSKLIVLDYKYNQQQKYGRFLYYLSSPMWRAQNREFAQSVEIEAKGFDLGGSNEDDTFTVLFDKMQRECFGNLVKPALYFNNASDLMDVFETIEKYQQYYFIHVSRLGPFAKSLNAGIAELREVIAQDTAAVASCINAFEARINFFYHRSKQLKDKFFKVLHGLFYQSVGAADVLKFTLHLEFCFIKVRNEDPTNMDFVAMAKALEDSYMNYMFQLEGLQDDNVKQAISQCTKEDKLKNIKCMVAARELRLFQRLEHELLISFAPVPKRGDKIKVVDYKPSVASNMLVKERSQSNVLSVKKMSLTDSEKEYLRLFTDWTENQDPSDFLHMSS